MGHRRRASVRGSPWSWSRRPRYAQRSGPVRSAIVGTGDSARREPERPGAAGCARGIDAGRSFIPTAPVTSPPPGRVPATVASRVRDHPLFGRLRERALLASKAEALLHRRSRRSSTPAAAILRCTNAGSCHRRSGQTRPAPRCRPRGLLTARPRNPSSPPRSRPRFLAGVSGNVGRNAGTRVRLRGGAADPVVHDLRAPRIHLMRWPCPGGARAAASRTFPVLRLFHTGGEELLPRTGPALWQRSGSFAGDRF